MDMPISNLKKVFDFESQLQQGFQGEAEIIAHLTAQGWRCTKANRDQERQGIDYITAKGKESRTIEIKSDSRATNTGNAFIETVSVLKGTEIIKKGWAYTCQANFLFYYLPVDLVAYVYQPSILRTYTDLWIKKNYRKVSVPNKGYLTQGILVPLWELENTAIEIINI
jgi:Holliday junction resolvase-like predicted endonuclease